MGSKKALSKLGILKVEADGYAKFVVVNQTTSVFNKIRSNLQS